MNSVLNKGPFNKPEMANEVVLYYKVLENKMYTIKLIFQLTIDHTTFCFLLGLFTPNHYLYLFWKIV